MTSPVTPTANVITGVVLAGGRSARFGRDKLAIALEGRPLLHHAIAAVAAVAQDVVVAGDAGPADLPDIAGVTVRRVPDAAGHSGPLAGLSTALDRAHGTVVLVVAGDMPALVPGLLGMLVDAVRDDVDVEAAALVHDGRREPLPVALRVAAAAGAVRRTREAGASSLQSLLASLAVREIAEPDWRRLDPAAASILDVDRPADLTR